MDVFSGQDAFFDILPEDNDNYAELTENDIFSYALYNIKGEKLIEDTSVDLTALEDKNSIHITIPAENNTLAESELFSFRILVANYTVNGSNKTKRINYRVVRFVPYTCTCDDVRNLLGIGDTVITDDMIDIYRGYLKCMTLFEDSTALDGYLESGTEKALLANKAIAICSALEFKNAFSLLVPKIETNGVASQTRFTLTKDDFDSIFEGLQDELQDLLSDLEDEDVESTFAPDLLTIGNMTDTFTGS